MEKIAKIARVAINARVYELFDYKINQPADIIGRRVCVPFHGKPRVGLVLEIAPDSPIESSKIKPIEYVFSDIPALPTETIALIRFCSSYYHWPIGMVVAAILPSILRRPKSFYLQSAYRLSSTTPCNHLIKWTPNMKKIMALLETHKVISTATINSAMATPKAALTRLLDNNIIERCRFLPPLPAIPAQEKITLTAQQNKVIAATVLNKGFVPHLLFGATGSGKSEVYFRLMQDVLEKQQQALILTPEIHLTPQLEEKIRQRFPTHHLVVLHSGLSENERARRWLMACMGDANIVLGTRLAIFTPMPHLGIIIVDEEHDDSYKQETHFNFSAIQVAAWRAKHNNIPYIAGSATPSLESFQKALDKKWVMLRMPERLHKAPLSFERIEEQSTLDYHGMQPLFIERLTQCIKAGNQALIFINRRAYSPVIMCQQCHQAIECVRCSTTMTVHKRRGIISCHFCGLEKEIPLNCPSCHQAMMMLGTGTQRIEEAVSKLFPNTSVLRLDSDISIPNFVKDSIDKRYQLLIGTQIIAKGHNFPNLALIGILNADSGLLATDLRSEERLFALLSQVIGRGTRNIKGCHIMMQTAMPSHPFFKELMDDNVDLSWKRQLHNRQQVQMPPFGHLALFRAKDKNLSKLTQFMKNAATSTQLFSNKVTVFDPVTPPIGKINTYYRQQLLMHSLQRSALHYVVHQSINSLSNKVHWSVDIDPRNF